MVDIYEFNNFGNLVSVSIIGGLGLKRDIEIFI